jgi:hypothetical protein
VDAVTVALSELRTLVYRLADEVAAFRRRALAAESRQRELEQSLQAMAPAPEAPAEAPPTDDGEAVSYEQLLVRVAELDAANAELRQRLEQASQRTRLLLERTRFLRQQQEQPEELS